MFRSLPSLLLLVTLLLFVFPAMSHSHPGCTFFAQMLFQISELGNLILVIAKYIVHSTQVQSIS